MRSPRLAARVRARYDGCVGPTPDRASNHAGPPESEPLQHDLVAVDWSSWVLTDEGDMGEGFEQGEIIRMLLSSLDVLAAERGWSDRLWAADQFFAWKPEQPLVRVSPDVYVLDHPPPPPRPPSWQTWMPGHSAPILAVEIVSADWKKDYALAPAKYCALGCPELVIFDPDAVLGDAGPERVALQVFRRDADGAYGRVHAGATPAWSSAIDAAFVAVQDGAVARLRLARDADARSVVPTLAEQRDQDASAREAEARARQAAEQRVRELEARVRELEGR